MKTLFLLAAVIAVSAAQSNQQYTTPVPILKQINRHNEDGSYSYGYEGADGSFKIESKYANGEVYGKYGYVDDTGKVREIEYGATNRGFEPVGNGINVPPPTLSNNKEAARPLGKTPGEEDDGQYREDPSVYYKDEKYNQPIARQPSAAPQQSRFQWNSAAAQPAQAAPAFRPQTNWNQASQWQQPQSYAAPQPQWQQQYQQPQQQYQQPQYRSNYIQPVNPAFPNFNQFGGHPASNIDINSGSYSVQYKR